MGQPIEVTSTGVDDIAMFDTDRTITGQDGDSFNSSQAEAATSIPGDLATRLFDRVAGIDHVFVASNQVVVRRPHGWDDHVIGTATKTITDFFLFY